MLDIVNYIACGLAITGGLMGWSRYKKPGAVLGLVGILGIVAVNAAQSHLAATLLFAALSLFSVWEHAGLFVKADVQGDA